MSFVVHQLHSSEFHSCSPSRFSICVAPQAYFVLYFRTLVFECPAHRRIQLLVASDLLTGVEEYLRCVHHIEFSPSAGLHWERVLHWGESPLSLIQPAHVHAWMQAVLAGTDTAATQQVLALAKRLVLEVNGELRFEGEWTQPLPALPRNGVYSIEEFLSMPLDPTPRVERSAPSTVKELLKDIRVDVPSYRSETLQGKRRDAWKALLGDEQMPSHIRARFAELASVQPVKARKSSRAASESLRSSDRVWNLLSALTITLPQAHREGESAPLSALSNASIELIRHVAFHVVSERACPNVKLLTGPPGGGKSYLVSKVIAEEFGFATIVVNANSLRHSLFGESEKSIEYLFTTVPKLFAPCVVLWEEIDTLFDVRDSNVSATIGQFKAHFESPQLVEQQNEHVYHFATTNKSRDVLEDALGQRFAEYEIPYPTAAQVVRWLLLHLVSHQNTRQRMSESERNWVHSYIAKSDEDYHGITQQQTSVDQVHHADSGFSLDRFVSYVYSSYTNQLTDHEVLYFPYRAYRTQLDNLIDEVFHQGGHCSLLWFSLDAMEGARQNAMMRGCTYKRFRDESDEKENDDRNVRARPLLSVSPIPFSLDHLEQLSPRSENTEVEGLTDYYAPFAAQWSPHSENTEDEGLFDSYAPCAEQWSPHSENTEVEGLFDSYARSCAEQWSPREDEVMFDYYAPFREEKGGYDSVPSAPQLSPWPSPSFPASVNPIPLDDLSDLSDYERLPEPCLLDVSPLMRTTQQYYPDSKIFVATSPRWFEPTIVCVGRDAKRRSQTFVQNNVGARTWTITEKTDTSLFSQVKHSVGKKIRASKVLSPGTGDWVDVFQDTEKASVEKQIARASNWELL